jgi:hypothetical protein
MGTSNIWACIRDLVTLTIVWVSRVWLINKLTIQDLIIVRIISLMATNKIVDHSSPTITTPWLTPNLITIIKTIIITNGLKNLQNPNKTWTISHLKLKWNNNIHKQLCRAHINMLIYNLLSCHHIMILVSILALSIKVTLMLMVNG